MERPANGRGSPQPALERADRREEAHRLRQVTLAEVPERLRQLRRRLADRRRERWVDPALTPADLAAAWVTPLPVLPDVRLGVRADVDWHGAWSTAPWTRVGRARDPRPTWERHRLGDGARLALSAGAAERAACLELLESWHQDNPPPCGIGWATGLEVACRAVNLVLAAAALGPARPPWMAGSLAAHARYLVRYPSVGSSANNHRAAELGALVVLGACSGLPGADAWLREGVVGLRDLLPTLIADDGTGTEQSTAYLAFTLEWALLARQAAARAGAGPGSAVDERLAAAAAFLACLAGPGTRCCPRLGDGDDGQVLPGPHDPERYPLSVAGAAAACLGRPECAPAAWEPDLRAELLGAAPLRAAPAPGGRSFLQGGTTVLANTRWRVVVDHGPLGFPHLAAHGHADALALWASADGQPLLVGRGTPRYQGEPSMRAAFRGTGAHSTVVVDRLDQSVQRGDWLWASRARARLLAAAHDPDGGRLLAEHDGYLARLGVRHRRSVGVAGDSLVVEDHLDGSGRHHVAVLLHLAPDLDLVRAEIARGRSVVAHLEHPGALTVERLHGSADPWALARHGPRYGEVVPATTIALSGTVELPFVSTFSLRLPPSARDEARGSRGNSDR